MFSTDLTSKFGYMDLVEEQNSGGTVYRCPSCKKVVANIPSDRSMPSFAIEGNHCPRCGQGLNMGPDQ